MRDRCPASGALVDFVDNALPASEADAVAQHLPGCELCSREVAVLRQSLNADPQDNAGDAGGETRMRERFRRFLLRQEGTKAHWYVPRSFITAALAASVLILLYPAYLGLKQMLPRVMPADPAAHIVRLQPVTRDANAQAPVIRPDKDAHYLGLMFFVPVWEPQSAKLDCRLRHGGRDVQATRNLGSFDELGNYLLLIRMSSLESGGDYVLTVARAGDAAREWQFPFTIEIETP